jgi:RNA polymerase sigma-70 factor (sigma-E family)
MVMNEALLVGDTTGALSGRSRAHSSDAVSFEDFVAARGSDLWRSAWLLTGDAHKAEDLVQTALLKCWRRWDSIARDGAVEGYVRRVLVSTYTDWWRRRWTGEVPTEAVPDVVAAGEQDLAEQRRDVLVALATLTRGQRAVLVLRYFEDLTEAETAAVLGVTVGTVKSQAARAMRALRSSPALTEPSEEGT